MIHRSHAAPAVTPLKRLPDGVRDVAFRPSDSLPQFSPLGEPGSNGGRIRASRSMSNDARHECCMVLDDFAARQAEHVHRLVTAKVAALYQEGGAIPSA